MLDCQSFIISAEILSDVIVIISFYTGIPRARIRFSVLRVWVSSTSIVPRRGSLSDDILRLNGIVPVQYYEYSTVLYCSYRTPMISLMARLPQVPPLVGDTYI